MIMICCTTRRSVNKKRTCVADPIDCELRFILAGLLDSQIDGFGNGWKLWIRCSIPAWVARRLKKLQYGLLRSCREEVI